MSEKVKNFVSTDWVKNVIFLVGVIFACGVLWSNLNGTMEQVRINHITIDTKVAYEDYRAHIEETCGRFVRIEKKLDDILFLLLKKK